MGKLSWHVDRPPPFAFVTPDQQIKPFGRSLGPKHAHLHPSNLRVDDITGSRPTQHCFTTLPRLTNPLEPHYPLPHHNHPQPAAPVLKFIKDPLDNSDIPGAQASPRIQTQLYKQNFRLDCSDVDGAAPGWQPDWKRAAKARHASLRPATAPTHRHPERAVRPSNYVNDIERTSPWHPSNADAHLSKVHAADVAASSHAAAQQLLQQKVQSAGPQAVATLWSQFRQFDREACGKLTSGEFARVLQSSKLLLSNAEVLRVANGMADCHGLMNYRSLTNVLQSQGLHNPRPLTASSAGLDARKPPLARSSSSSGTATSSKEAGLGAKRAQHADQQVQPASLSSAAGDAADGRQLAGSRSGMSEHESACAALQQLPQQPLMSSASAVIADQQQPCAAADAPYQAITAPSGIVRSQVRSLCKQQCELLVISGKPAGHAGPSQTEGAAHLIEVLLPALRSDMAALSLPYDMEVQHKKLESTHTVSAACTALPRAPSDASIAAQDSSQPAATAAAASGAHDDLSASKATSEMTAKAVDESPIRSVIKQTSLGARVSPSIGRRTTPFSTSTPNDSDGVESSPADDQSTFLRALHDHHAAADGLSHQEAPSQDCVPSAQYTESSHNSCSRPYLTCCVRLSPEKEPHRFVELVEELASQGIVQQLGIIPVMCASATTPYALALVTRLQAAVPNCIIHTQFLGPEELAQIYSKTRLNIHPCLYDAYGMTVVEAASQGAPSVVNAGGTVGAADLLQAPLEVFELNLALPVAQLASQVAQLWEDASRLAEVGQAAVQKARSWTELANASVLLTLVDNILQSGV